MARAGEYTISWKPVEINRRQQIAAVTDHRQIKGVRAERLQGRYSPLPGPDPDRIFDIGDEYFAVSDFAGSGGTDNRFHDGLYLIRTDNDFNLDFGNEIDLILRSAIELGVPFLLPESLYLGDSHTEYSQIGKSVFDIVEFKGFDDEFNSFHR